MIGVSLLTKKLMQNMTDQTITSLRIFQRLLRLLRPPLRLKSFFRRILFPPSLSYLRCRMTV